jgi:hypothetical protein
MYGIVEIWLHTFLTSTLYADEWSAPSSSLFIPEVRVTQCPENGKLYRRKHDWLLGRLFNDDVSSRINNFNDERTDIIM